MFRVKGLPILTDEVEVLTELKRQVYEKTGKEILRKIKKSGRNIMICCPIHNNGQERKPSCGVSITDGKVTKAGQVHCFSCGYVDTLEGMISKCFGYDDISYGTRWLLDNFVTGDIDERPDIPIDLDRTPKKVVINYVPDEELQRYRGKTHPYMYQRKLTDEIIKKYDIGYQDDYVFSEGWNPTPVITFPVRDKTGGCLFVSRRAIYGKTFFLPPDIEKPIYGLYELPENCRSIIVCESVFNALTCVAYGRPAVALFGTGDENQYNILKSLGMRGITLGLDPDKAGNKGTNKLFYQLKNKCIVTKLVIPDGKDINDLSYDEFIKLPEVFF